MSKLYIVTLFIISIVISGCFPEDEVYPIKPIEGLVGEINESIYDAQAFYSLSENLTQNSNAISTWDLGFRSSKEGNHVILNSGDVLKIANLGPVSFIDTLIPENTDWKYDASSGNLDSLAISNWVDVNTNPYTYSHNVYVIAKNEVPFKKFKLIDINDDSYTLVISALDIFDPDTVIVTKNNHVNYTKLSLQTENTIIPIEPNTALWDFQFSSYQTIIPDDFGVATPYFVRGVLLNPNETSVAKYYISEDDVPVSDNEENDLEVFFIQFKQEDNQELSYSAALDVIGHDWKIVDIDFTSGSGTAAYKADLRKVYIIKTQTGEIFKLRFISYYNAGVKGYPKFQYALFE